MRHFLESLGVWRGDQSEGHVHLDDPSHLATADVTGYDAVLILLPLYGYTGGVSVFSNKYVSKSLKHIDFFFYLPSEFLRT